MLNKYKIEEIPSSDTGGEKVTVKKKVTIELEKRNIIINDLFNLDQYKRITFT